MMTTKVGFIGLGAMGRPMAANLLRKGFPLSLYDVDPDRAASLAELGGQAAGSVADAVKGAEVVVTMLPATQHVEAVVFGDGGILASIGGGAVLMDMSTIDANGTDRIAAACARHGVPFADCPVGRLAMHAERGESLFMVGADDPTFELIRPLLDAMGTAIHRCGLPGSGSRMKLVNNFMLLTIAEVCAEAIALGSKLGLGIETMRDVTAATTAQNGQFHTLMVNKVLVGDTAPGFTIDLAFKDMTLAMTAAAELRMGLPVGAAAYAVFGGARAGDYAGQDYSSLLSLACERAGVPVPRLDISELPRNN